MLYVKTYPLDFRFNILPYHQCRDFFYPIAHNPFKKFAIAKKNIQICLESTYRYAVSFRYIQQRRLYP